MGEALRIRDDDELVEQTEDAEKDAGATLEEQGLGNQKAFMDITIDGKDAGRLTFDLYNKKEPKTVENFEALCKGDKGKGKETGKDLTYAMSPFHRVITGFMAQGGDFENQNGTGGESIWGGKFKDENMDLTFNKKHMLAMANAGPNTNGSQFFITFKETPHLNGKHTIFGELEEGSVELLDKIEALGSSSGETSKAIAIKAAGVM